MAGHSLGYAIFNAAKLLTEQSCDTIPKLRKCTLETAGALGWCALCCECDQAGT